MIPSYSERRAEPRLPASGYVRLVFEDPLPATVQVELVETSGRGFRVAHASPRLVPGLEVKFSVGTLSGRARVMWTHVEGSRRVSGFLIF